MQVADELSFVNAARSLHMTQPALSRQIAALERELGVRLFDRSRTGTGLTAAGERLRESARALLRSASEFEREARIQGRGVTEFVVGFMPGVDAAELIAIFQARYPHVLVDAVFTSMTAQAAFLLDGRVDVAFVRPPLHLEGVRVVPLFDEPVVAAVHRSDPLADRAQATMLDIERSGAIVITLDRQVAIREGGPARRYGPEDATLAVATGGIVALLPVGIAAFYTDPVVRYVPVVDAPRQQVAIAYDERRVMPEVVAFARICREELRRRIHELPRRLVEDQRSRAGARP